MGATPTPQTAELSNISLPDPLAALSPGEVVGVAFSGGVDSSALLHAALAAAPSRQCRVVALHVHHGLQQAADAWWDHVQAQCLAYQGTGADVTLLHVRLQPASHLTGQSLEDWARQARYAALADMAHQCQAKVVLLAHHQQDQAETFFLQALRGAGVRGLAAMPASVVRQGLRWHRPWLQVARRVIADYALAHQLSCVDDPSNQDFRFLRSRWRSRCWPGIQAMFPQASQALAQSAAWAQEAAECLQALAQMDVSAMAAVPPWAHGQAAIQLSVWRAWPPARRRNALRHWLRWAVMGEPGPSAALINRLDRELCGPAQAAQRWALSGRDAGAGHLWRYRDHVVWVPTSEGASVSAVSGRVDRCAASELMLTGPGVYEVPSWGGCLRVRVAQQQGLPALSPTVLWVRPRRGGESFQRDVLRPARSLKKQYQDAGVPVWLRRGPLLWSAADQLVWVPGLGVDARAWAAPRNEQWQLQWHAHSAA